MEDLEGLEYDELVMDHNVHKLIDNVTKKQGNGSANIKIDEGSIWLAVSLGQLVENTPDDAIAESIKNIIIVDKNNLIEFINSKK